MILKKKRKDVLCILQLCRDADVDIVINAVASAEIFYSIVIGEDADLLILLLYHAKYKGFKLFFHSDIRRDV